MPVEIFALVATASLLHAGWNFLIKKVGGGALAIWLCAVCMTAFLLPFTAAYFWLFRPQLTDNQWFYVAATGVVHLTYFLVLQKGYAVADLSVVYPVARGTGPLLASLGAVALLGEEMSGRSAAGLGVIVLGVLVFAGGPLFHQKRNGAVADSTPLPSVWPGIGWGLLTGSLIASYTLLDGWAVRPPLAIAPIVIEFFSHPLRIAVLAPVAWRRWPEVREIWARHSRKIWLVSMMAPTGFLLILWSMQRAPVHLVAPAREMSIVIGVALGGRFLAEKDWEWRLGGACLIFLGIGLLAFGRPHLN